LKLTVVIPAYNVAPYLSAALDSLLVQIPDQTEILVVNDGSTDDTMLILESYRKRYNCIRYISCKNSGGPAHPRNLGVKDAKGDIIMFFDADDIAMPLKIQSTLDAFETYPDCSLLFTNFSIIDKSGTKVIRERYTDPFEAFRRILGQPVSKDTFILKSTQLFSELIRYNFIGTSGVAVRRSALALSSGFNENYRILDDRDMWLQLSNTSNAIYIDCVLHHYRQHELGISKNNDKTMCYERLNIVKRYKRFCNEDRAKKNLIVLKAKNHNWLGQLYSKEKQFSRSTIHFLSSLLSQPNWQTFKNAIKSTLRLTST